MKAFDIDFVLKKTISKADNSMFIETQISTRLDEDGTDVFGKKLKTFGAAGGGVYAFSTQNIRRSEGLQIEHVDLKVTGEFHDSFKINQQKSSFLIIYQDEKKDGKVSDNIDLKPIIDLSEKEKGEVSEYIKLDFIENVRKEINI